VVQNATNVSAEFAAKADLVLQGIGADRLIRSCGTCGGMKFSTFEGGSRVLRRIIHTVSSKKQNIARRRVMEVFELV